KKRDAWITNRMKILQQDYYPEHIALTLKRNGIDALIAVQADQSELETHFLVEMSKTHDNIKGVVGWIDLQNENIAERLDYFAQYSIIKGWRHIVQGEKDDFMYGKPFRNGLATLQTYNYTYDILIYHHQLKAVLDLVNDFPEQKFIIDHCAKPDIKEKKIDEWKVLIKAIAQNPNVYCKLSGLFTEAAWKSWSPAEFYPYLDIVFEAFGTDRLLYGSDWPVLLLSGSYVQWKSLLEKYMENFKEEDKLKVFGDNAIQFYNLQS
ncbi:MAG TPA: amidohydrolase family protein, partial [Chitinophagaceae bacterium]|nr:amidohydrolase family protein [Chitinophagaceae bacterium]